MYNGKRMNRKLICRMLGILSIIAAVSFASSAQAQSGSTVLTGTSSIRLDLGVTGALSKGSGSFVIDHPLDPKNKLLYHSFVESPDVKNIYDGMVTLNWRGEAHVKLPRYFEALNEEYRYLATPIGKPAPNLYVKRGVKGNSFVIAGGNPGQRISWQVTGIRHDPYILANLIVPEVLKGSNALVDVGEYLFPELYGR